MRPERGRKTYCPMQGLPHQRNGDTCSTRLVQLLQLYEPRRSRFIRDEDGFGSVPAAAAPSRHVCIGTWRPTCSHPHRRDGFEPRCAWSVRRRVGRRAANLQRHRGQL